MHPNDTPGLPSTQFADDWDPSLISAIKVAEKLRLQLDEFARMGRLDPEMLSTNLGSADIQGMLGNLVRVFSFATAVFMNDTVATVWMTNPLREFRGETAFTLVVKGRTEEVIRYLDSIESGFVG